MIMKKSGSAVWQGTLKEGQGKISTETGALNNAPYGFNSRFGDEKQTNPEELIGAAHAGCFSMALSKELENAGISPGKIETTATVTLEKVENGFAVTSVHLDLKATLPDADKEAFEAAAEAAKKGCPLSKLLKAEITLETVLVN
ncbi:MAG: OsmC family protein [Alphaproteobacteria bacterium]|nr:OsmC family protein [Alphaproteobacteria bacterium]